MYAIIESCGKQYALQDGIVKFSKRNKKNLCKRIDNKQYLIYNKEVTKKQWLCSKMLHNVEVVIR